MKKFTSISIAVIGIVLFLAGCGGGSAQINTNVITGTVTAPSGTTGARSAGRTAAMIGNSPISATLVASLANGDSYAEAEALAMVYSNQNGEYSIPLPQNISPSSNLIITATYGDGNNVMRTIATSRTANVSPVSEMVVANIINRNLIPSSLTSSEIDAIMAQAESDTANVDLSKAKSLEEALGTLEEETESSSLSAMITAAGSGDYEPGCGNSVVETGETCDDGNTTAGDGCSATCSTESSDAGSSGGTASDPVCGNGQVETGETCDDGNTTTEACSYGEIICTVCNASCQSVTGQVSYCGDGSVDSNNQEQCDSGSSNGTACTADYGASCDYCSSTCQSQTVQGAYCGDGTVNGSEFCDDGNTTSGDGCFANCKWENEIVYHINTESSTDDREIYTMMPDGSQVMPLTDNDSQDAFPIWSPDRSKIAFASDRNGQYDMYIMDADGSNVQQLTTQGTFKYPDPSFSPDGSMLAFISTDASYTYTICIYSFDTAQLINTGTTGYAPTFSPDGTSIYYGKISSINSMNTDGTNPQILRAFDYGTPREFAFSPDGTKLAFEIQGVGASYIDNVSTGSPSGIFIVSADTTGAVTHITVTDRYDWSPTWSSDSSTLLINDDLEGRFFKYDLSTETTTEISNTGYDFGPNWY